MALAATIVWEVRTAGSDTLCSGGFNSAAAGTDYSQQAAAQYTGTNLVIDATTNTKVTSATHNFVAADVGNLMQITAGSGFTTGFFEIVSVAANAATLDRSAGTLGSTAGTFAVGGALATPGLAVANLVAGHTIYAAGSYTTTTNTVNVAGGRLDFTTTGTQAGVNRFIGYTTTRTDGGKYTITLGSTFVGPAINLNSANSFNHVHNVAVVGTATSGAAGAVINGRSNWLTNSKFSGFGSGGADIVTVGVDAFIKDFEISGGATGTSSALAVGTAMVVDGWIHGNAGRGMTAFNNHAALIRVESAEHTGGNGYGFLQASEDVVYFECAGWNNAAGDFWLADGACTALCIRCVSGGGGGYNWQPGSATRPDAYALYYCAAKANTSGLYPVTPNINVGMVTLTGDPWTARTSGDFSLNSTAGAGAVLKGIVETIFSLTTTYADIGPAQHQDAGGGPGGTGPNVIVSSGAGSRGGSW